MKRSVASTWIFGAGVVWCSLTLGSLDGSGQEAKPPDDQPPTSGPVEREMDKLLDAIESTTPLPLPDAPPLRQSAKPDQSAAAPTRGPVEREIDKLFDAIDLTPQPVPEIPDDPPPHEGAMIDMPEYRIEPPDLVLVEVLEALPGRPISGERLVRPDGKISLGFYGELHVRGLTIRQAKVKIIKRMREFLTDEVLGLKEPKFEPPAEAKTPSKPEEAKADEPVKAIEEPVKTQEILIQDGTGVSIRIELKHGIKPPPEEPSSAEAEMPDMEDPKLWKPVPPDQSERVFVDITAFNSKNYYVLGDVGAPGKLPITGTETVLDALQYAGGLLATAEPNDVRLVRPGRDGKPGKVYKVDLEAIQERGETATNYQMFPNDRLIIGRNDVVKKTIQINRLSLAIQDVIASLRQEALMISALKSAVPDQPEVMLKNAVEFWIREMKRPDGVVLDQDILRDALIHRLPVKPDEPKPEK